MEVVALVPARGGSKGIPRKNLAPLVGRPLLAHAVDAATASGSTTRVVVTTDDDEIARVAVELHVEVVRRPGALAADATPMVDVALHACAELRLADEDVLVLLQPTSPLRRAVHVDEAVEILLTTSADSVVSVVAVPHQYRPESLMRIDGGRLVPLVDAGFRRRQDKELVWARNGPAVVAVRVGPFRASGDLYGGDCRPYVMDEADSVDVDGELDLLLAELLLRRR